MKDEKPVAVHAEAVPAREATGYPPPFDARVRGRAKRALGDLFGLSQFGVNMTTLAPGAQSALRHAHARADEFVFILSGTPTLVTDEGETPLEPGMCAGFPAGGTAHHLINRGAEPVTYLEIGTRHADDSVIYPDDAMTAEADENGGWRFVRDARARRSGSGKQGCCRDD